MAITWGSYNNDGANGMRLGYEITQSPSTVGTGTSSVVVTLKIYFGSRYSIVDSTNTLSITGDFSHSGSESINHGSSGGTTLLQTETRTVSTSYTSTDTSNFSATISGINAIPGTASVSGSLTTAKRPISAPAAPTGMGVSRNSDTSHTISWTRTNPTSASNPYQNMELQRWDNVGNTWATIVTLGSVSSYTNTSTKADRQYRWRVRAKNSAGASAYIYSGYWSTTPASPNTPVASKISNDIKLTWTNRATEGTGIEIWHAENGVWEGAVETVLSGQPTTYTNINPDPAKTHTYKLKAIAGQSDDAPNLYSAFSGQSNTIQLLTNPAAPTQLSPTSGVKDAATQAIVLSWNHNEVDGTAQTKYDIQYRMNGGSWTTVSATTATQSKTFAAGTLANGAQMDWQVRTYGQYATAPAYSPWSAMATLTLSAAPEAGVVFPDGATPVATSRITAQWSYSDEEATAQAQWKVKLYSAGGATLLETKIGTGTDTSVDLSTLLLDGLSYRLGVSVQDGTGLWSPETTEDFSVAYALPDAPTVSLSWDADRSAVVAAIDNPTGGAGAAVDHNELWRSVDWETYELVADNIPVNSTVTDYIPATATENVYLVVAVTAIEAAVTSEPVVFETPGTGDWFIINGGPAFSTLVQIRYNAELTRSFARDKTLNKYAGRTFPVETVGEQRSREYDLAVAVLGEDDATLDQLEAVADIPGPLVLRTPDSKRIFMSLNGIGSQHVSVFENVTMKLTQVDKPNTGTMAFEPVVYRTNRATNPSFDTTTNTLVAGGVTTTIDAGDAASGANFLHATHAAGGTFLYAGQSTTIPAGFTYVRASIAVRNLAGAGFARIRFGYRDSPSSGTITYTTMTEGIAAIEWETVVIEGVIPSTTQYVNVVVYPVDGPSSTTTPAGTEWAIDSLLIEVGSTAEDTGSGGYFDGDTWEGDAVLDPRWTGTAGASTSELTRGGTTS